MIKFVNIFSIVEFSFIEMYIEGVTIHRRERCTSENSG